MARKSKNINLEKNQTALELNLENDQELTADFNSDIEINASLFLTETLETEGFLPDILEDEISDKTDELDRLATASDIDLAGTELEGFEAAEISEVEFIEEEQVQSIIESILFASDRPVSLASIKEVFKGTNVRKDKIKRILDQLAVEYASGLRGVTLEEITGGYQLRTKIDNMNFLKRTVKARPFKLSGPALETLAIVAYKQPVVKSEIDQIRGVESGHLLRALMEKGLCAFEGKAENLPGRPMQYGTTRRFLEIFGLRNLKELPTLSQIDELLPEGIGEDEDVEQKPTLATVTDSMSTEVIDVSYSQGEEDLLRIEDELQTISTSSDFFEQEKIRQKQKRDAEKAQDIRDAMTMNEDVPKRDKTWLKKYEESLLAPVLALQTEASANELTLEESTTATETQGDAEVSENTEEPTEELSEELPFYGEADEIDGALS